MSSRSFWRNEADKIRNDRSAVEDGPFTNEYLKSVTWVDESNSKKEVTCIKFEKTIFFLRIELDKSARGKNIDIKILDSNTYVSSTEIKKSSIYVNSDALVWFAKVELNVNDFIKTGQDDVAKYIAKLEIDNGKFSFNDKLTSNGLICHAVIYIPDVMKAMGWEYSYKSQVDWFKGKANNYPWESEPKLFDMDIDWALGFNKFRKICDEYISEYKILDDVKARKSLNNEIKKMIKNGDSTLPTQRNTKTYFGTYQTDIVQIKIYPEEFNERTVKSALEYVPLFEKYYFKSIEYNESKFSPLDDFFGSIANCGIHVCAIGTLEYIDEDKIEVHVTEMVYYIKDGFDYVGRQPLGFWSFIDKDVTKFSTSGNYRYIDNASYRNYRLDAKEGGDFYRYSSFEKIKTDKKFEYEK